MFTPVLDGIALSAGQAETCGMTKGGVQQQGVFGCCSSRAPPLSLESAMGSQTLRKARQMPCPSALDKPRNAASSGNKVTPHLDSRPGLRGERKTGGQSQGGTTGLDAEVPSFSLRTGSVLRLWAGLSEDGNQVVRGVKGAGT